MKVKVIVWRGSSYGSGETQVRVDGLSDDDIEDVIAETAERLAQKALDAVIIHERIPIH